MSTFFNKPSDLVAGTTARANDINDRVDSTEAGFDNVALVVDRGIKLPVGTTGDQVITESASNRASKTVGFDSSGDLTLYAPYNWKGDWASATAYALHDTIRYASTKNLYFCTDAHTAGTFATDVAASKWSLAIDVSAVETAKAAAQTAKTAAELAETNAETAETNAETAKTAAETAKGLAEDWAVKTSATVDGTNYSAKYWATSADVVVVAGKATQLGLLGTTDAVADMNTLGTSDVVSDMNILAAADVVHDMNILATADIVSDMNTLGTSDVVSDMNTLGTADVVSDMNTLGTADVVSDMNTLATAAILADLSTVANISSGVTSVAGKETQIGLLGTSAAIADMNTLGTADVVADMNTLAVADVIADMNTLGTADVVADMNTLGTADVVADMNTLGTSAIVTDMDLLATPANVTAMGILGTSSAVADMAILGTTAVVADMAILGTTDVVADLALLGTTDVVSDMNTLAVADVIADMNTLGTADVVTDLNTLGTADVVLDMNVLGTSANVTAMDTCAANIVGVNSFADRYRVAATAPTTSLDEGDLYFNTTDDKLYHYTGSVWVAITAYSHPNLTGEVTSTGTASTVIAGNVVDEANLKVSNAPTNGYVLTAQSAATGGMTWAADNNTVYVHPNHSGEVTSTADGATVIAGNVVDEANLKVSNAPTNGYVLTAQSAATGGMTWAADNNTVYVHPNHSGEVTSTADGATVIAGNVVDEANLKVSNAPTNGQFLSAQSAATGGMTWAEVDALPSQTGHSGKYLTTDATNASWATLDTDANSTTKGLYEMANTISSNYSITSGNNALTAGPITINTGISVTIPTGSTWVIA